MMDPSAERTAQAESSTLTCTGERRSIGNGVAATATARARIAAPDAMSTGGTGRYLPGPGDGSGLGTSGGSALCGTAVVLAGVHIC